MTTAWDRRHHQAAQAATDRAQQLADSWEHAAPRRALNGHHQDCPNRLEGWMRRCPWCIAQARGVDPAQRTALTAPAATSTTNPELRQCPRCFGPTTDPEGHCT